MFNYSSRLQQHQQYFFCEILIQDDREHQNSIRAQSIKNAQSRFEIFEKVFKIIFYFNYTTQQKTGYFLSASYNQLFFIDLHQLNYDTVLFFISAPHVSEIILNESSKSTENTLIE
jgi:hypothetical protein